MSVSIEKGEDAREIAGLGWSSMASLGLLLISCRTRDA